MMESVRQDTTVAMKVTHMARDQWEMIKARLRQLWVVQRGSREFVQSDRNLRGSTVTG